VASVFDAILLRLLLVESLRIPRQILNFTGRRSAARQAWIFRAAACFPLVFRRFSQHERLREPDVKVGRHLADERFAALVESVQELAVAAVQFVKRPGFDADPVAQRSVHQIEGDLRLRLKLDLAWNVVFLRRAGSLAHSAGRYKRASSRQWKLALA
jgi:hypothetical protein